MGFLGLVVVMFFAVVYGFYTTSGSAINKHPNDGLDGAPGAAGPSEASGKGRSTGDTGDGHSDVKPVGGGATGLTAGAPPLARAA